MSSFLGSSVTEEKRCVLHDLTYVCRVLSPVYVVSKFCIYRYCYCILKYSIKKKPLEQAIEVENPEEIEDEIDLEELFYPHPINDVTVPVPDQLIDSAPQAELEANPLKH